MSVYAVPLVVAAAFPVSQLSGEVVTPVKLTHVILFGSVVVIVALIERTRGVEGAATKGWPIAVPWFVALFFILALLRSTGILEAPVAGPTRELSPWLTIVAMAGLGRGVDLTAVRQTGPRVAAALIVSLAFLVGLTLVLIRLLGIDG